MCRWRGGLLGGRVSQGVPHALFFLGEVLRVERPGLGARAQHSVRSEGSIVQP